MIIALEKDRHVRTILGIETSCDDTCSSIVIDGHQILSNIISSQNDLHSPFGGIVPEVAARKHVEKISYIVEESIRQANLSLDQIDAIAVTEHPGLASSLMIGITFAKALAFSKRLPILGINHIEGHIYAPILEHPNILFPHLCLTVSGGHTLLVLVKSVLHHEILGTTTDDSAGEAFDKVARILGLGFPGGPIIDKLSQNVKNPIFFPSPLLDSPDFNFSFSGLKTAVKYYCELQGDFYAQIPSIASGFQLALVKVLIKKTMQAAKNYKIKCITLSGGVSANTYLKSQMLEACQKYGFSLYYPKLSLCTDNASMIAGLAYYKFKQG